MCIPRLLGRWKYCVTTFCVSCQSVVYISLNVVLMSTASEVNNEGFISYLGPADYEHSIELLREFGERVIVLQEGEFLLPTFNDLSVNPTTRSC